MPRTWWGAQWFGKPQHDKQTKQTNKQPSLINRFAFFFFSRGNRRPKVVLPFEEGMYYSDQKSEKRAKRAKQWDKQNTQVLVVDEIRSYKMSKSVQQTRLLKVVYCNFTSIDMGLWSS